MIETFAIIVAALALDRVLGEPTRWHPLAGFGSLASRVEQCLWRANATPGQALARGAIGWMVLVAPPTLFLVATGYLPDPIRIAIDILVLYGCLGWRSLDEHARDVARPLGRGDLAQARRSIARIVSRDPDALDSSGVTRAAIESVLENGNDAIVATLFWYGVLGAPGAALHRLANTLDAMWGYRTPRHLYFGRVAARLDDALAFVPARLTAIGYALAGNLRSAVACWREQARHAASPNAGVVMAAGAGALAIRVGGPAVYHGQRIDRPWFGAGRDAVPEDVARALTLLRRAICICLGLAGGGAVLVALLAG